jgi:hypothetical protein
VGALGGRPTASHASRRLARLGSDRAGGRRSRGACRRGHLGYGVHGLRSHPLACIGRVVDRLSHRTGHAFARESVETPSDGAGHGPHRVGLVRLGLRGGRARPDKPRPEHHQWPQGDQVGDQRGPDGGEPDQADREHGAEHPELRGHLGAGGPSAPRPPGPDHRPGAGHCVRDGRNGPRLSGALPRLPPGHRLAYRLRPVDAHDARHAPRLARRGASPRRRLRRRAATHPDADRAERPS